MGPVPQWSNTSWLPCAHSIVTEGISGFVPATLAKCISRSLIRPSPIHELELTEHTPELQIRDRSGIGDKHGLAQACLSRTILAPSLTCAQPSFAEVRLQNPHRKGSFSCEHCPSYACPGAIIADSSVPQRLGPGPSSSISCLVGHWPVGNKARARDMLDPRGEGALTVQLAVRKGNTAETVSSIAVYD